MWVLPKQAVQGRSMWVLPKQSPEEMEDLAMVPGGGEAPKGGHESGIGGVGSLDSCSQESRLEGVRRGRNEGVLPQRGA